MTAAHLSPAKHTSGPETPFRIVFAAGGTGGHIAPGIALAESLRAASSTHHPAPVAICSDRPIDARVLGAAVDTGVIGAFVPIPARPLARSPKKLIALAMRWGPSVRLARNAIRSARKAAPSVPLVLVTTGGFVAPPAVQAARVEGIPVVLINLDATPGKAGRFIARRAALRLDAALDAALDPNTARRTGYTPIPPLVRETAMARVPAEKAR
ncbi:MAG: glycosyltransferase, partial [Planctomycetota bacterium]